MSFKGPFQSNLSVLLWIASQGTAWRMRILAEGARRWEAELGLVVTEVHFGAADSRGQHGDRLAPAAASPACVCLLRAGRNSPGPVRLRTRRWEK